MGWSGSIKIVRTPASNFFSSSGRPKTWKMVFFRVSHIYGTFWSRRPYMGSTMWKLTSWRFGKCDGFPCSDVLNPSYGWSKSTESEILSLSSKIVGVTKKRHGHNFQNFGSILNQRQSNPLFSTLIQYGTEIWKIVAVSFFLNAANLLRKILRFDPTLNSHNSGLKPSNCEKYHIFGKPWTSAFTWLPLEKSY